MSHFQLDRSEDESFQDEKRFLIKSIRELREPERTAPPPQQPQSNTATPTSTATPE